MNRRALALRLVDSVIGFVLAAFLLSFLWVGFDAQGVDLEFETGVTSTSGQVADNESADPSEIKQPGPTTQMSKRLAVAGAVPLTR
jgi:hypothetical protein